MGYCNLCNRFHEEDGLCVVCRTTVFQLSEIMRSYLEDDSPPEWLTDSVGEFAWILEEYPPTAAFFNVAQEVLYAFILDEQNELPADDLKELAFTNWPRDRVLHMLEVAKVVELTDGHVFPGKLTKNLMNIRWAGNQLAADDYTKQMIEFRGILTISLVYSLLQEDWLVTNRALGVIGIFSLLIISEINPSIIDDTTFKYALSHLNARQKRRIEYHLTGLRDGVPKMIDDATDAGLVLKPCMINYVERMRERYRERAREARMREN